MKKPMVAMMLAMALPAFADAVGEDVWLGW